MARLSTVFLGLLLLSLTSAREICEPVRTCVRALRRGRECPLLPVPEANLQGPLPAQGFELQEIRPGVFSYNDRVYFSMIIYRDDRLVLIDFPESSGSVTADGEYLVLTAAMQVLNGSIPMRIDMIYSHRHLDHIGRAGFVKDNVEELFPDAKIRIFGTRETVEFLSRPEMSRVPAPNVIVGRSGRAIEIAPQLQLNLTIFGGHTRQDLVSLIPPSDEGVGVLHYVDMVTPNSAPFIDFGLNPDLGRYLEAQREVLELDWTVFSPGHGSLGSKSDIRRNIRYTEFVINAAATAGASVPPEEFARIDSLLSDPSAVQFGNAAWATISRIQLLVDVCARRVIRRWGCILSGVDVFVPTHCKEAILFNTIDNQM